MKKSTLMLAIMLLVAACRPVAEKEAVDYVNPFIGNISHLLVPTYPTIQLPHSMLRVTANKGDYTSELLEGFPLMQPSHRGGKVFTLSVTHEIPSVPVVSTTYDHEKVTPYSYDVDIDNSLTHISFAPSHQSAIYQITTMAENPLVLTIHANDGEVNSDGNSITGWENIGNSGKAYFYMEVEQKPQDIAKNGQNTVFLTFEEKDLSIRYGISYISTEQAQKNLRREIADYDIKAVTTTGRKIWNEALSRIQVQGGTEDERTVLYTSFYHTLERPMCISEDGYYWSAYDGQVHKDEGKPYFADDWFWDTFRAAHPLRILFDSPMEENILTSYLRAGQQKGNNWFPTFPGVTGDENPMNCNHGIISLLDALTKGLDIDKDQAYLSALTTLQEKSLIPWTKTRQTRIDSFYWEKGFFPAIPVGEKEDIPEVTWEKRQTVPVTLGTSYDCWAMSKLAEATGHTDEAEQYRLWSFNFRNLFNKETGFFHPKDAQGEFIPNLDYTFCGTEGGREYYDENNGWIYRWEVQHNVPDLINLMGGNEQFCKALDQMYATPLGRSKFDFYAKYPDHTGNVGQFSMANEPAFHIPYLYNYAGAPWKTQKRIRQMLDTWYRNDLMGIPGDEDGGGMTAFVVFSALGFYPVTPGEPIYSIGSPLFTRSEMRLTNGKVFTVVAEGASHDNKYIQSATLNGEPWNEPWITHEAIMKGGTLQLVMGPKPNMTWGTK